MTIRINSKQPVAVLAGTVLSLLGCTGQILGDGGGAPSNVSSGGAAMTGTSSAATGGGGGVVATPSACEGDPETRLPPLYRSLTWSQYRNVLRGAFPAEEATISAIENPWRVSEISTRYTTDATSLKMNQAALSAMLEGAGAIAAAARPDLVAAHPCLEALAGADRNQCLRGVVDGLLGALYNGEVLEAERATKVDYLSRLIDDFGIELALETFASTVMMSPRALFRSELGAPAADGRQQLSARELAEALSFAVAGTRPDAPLLEAISDANLSAEEILEHAQRLSQSVDESGAEAFVGEVFSLAQLAEVTRTDGMNADALPEAVRAALQLEARETVKRFVRSGGATLDKLLTSGTALARQETLDLHGVDATSLAPDAAGFYELTAPSRPGLLLQPSVMALLAAEHHSDPVKRGNFVMDRLLCVATPPPPLDIPPLPPVDADKPLTMRERLQTVHKLDACQGCHRPMDGIGLSFEAFDHLGRERTMEAGRPVDTSGEVVLGIPTLDGALGSAQELMTRLSGVPEVRNCVSAQAFTFLSGVYATTGYQGCVWQTVEPLVAGSDGNLVNILATLLASDLYRVRFSDGS